MDRTKGIALYSRAKQLIPGGTQLLSKRPEMFLPGEWPSYYSKCRGAKVWDLDGNQYTDMTISGVGGCPLGYADPDVDRAVTEAINTGNMCTLNVPQEIELAELFVELHPWAQMVRYARTGGEAMAVSIRIARAATGKDKILFCGYHGWHDWYLSANLASDSTLDGHLLPGLEAAGVPRTLQGTSFPFNYNDLDSFQDLLNRHKDETAAVVMEPVRNHWPQDGFLEGIRELTMKHNIPLVFDEVTSGLRMNTGGIHLKLGINPDLAVFAKGLGNGYPMAAIIGKTEFMTAAQKSFISSTYWTDRIGPTAALATLRKHRDCNVGSYLVEIGNSVQQGWRNLAKKHNIQIEVSGIPPLSHWKIKVEKSQLLHTVIVKEMLEQGFLTSKAFYANYAHTRDDVKAYLNALDQVLIKVISYLKDGRLTDLYSSEVAHSGFKRLT